MAGTISRRLFTKALACCAFGGLNRAEEGTPQRKLLSIAEVEQFLQTAEVIKKRLTKVGLTSPVRVTLSNAAMTHDAHVQRVDVSKPTFETLAGMELNFRDSWKFNVAGYRMDRLLGLNMTPISVARKFEGRSAAFTWWIDDAMMEGERQRKKIEPPDVETFNRQMQVLRVFDQLICNTDRNQQNILITKDWKLWMIDHTRAFRTLKIVRTPKNLVRCERRLLEKMRGLSQEALNGELGEYLLGREIEGVLARRDLIVKTFEEKIAIEGESRVLYDLPPREPAYLA